MKNVIMKKLASRKLWVAIVGVVVGLAAAFGVDAGEYEQIAGVVTSAASVVAYIFAEGRIDAFAAGNARIAEEEKEKEHAQQ